MCRILIVGRDHERGEAVVKELQEVTWQSKPITSFFHQISSSPPGV